MDEMLARRMGAIPTFETLQLIPGEIGGGRAVLTAPYSPKYNGIFESFHGGLLMTLADTAACVAVLTLAGANATIATTDMNIRFLAPCKSAATAAAKVIKLGKSLCPVDVWIADETGKQVAWAQVTYMRLPAMPER